MPIIDLRDTDDLSDRLLRPYSGMTDGQLRRGEGFRRDNPEGLFIGESARVIERALDAGIRPVSMLVDDRWFAHDRALVERVLAAWPAAPVFRVSPAQFGGITGYEVVRGALACFARPPMRAPSEVLVGARRVAVLEDVTNYANMGAIFRSAAALGFDAVLVSGSCHDPLYRRCARVSMGAVFQVPWASLARAGKAAVEGAGKGAGEGGGKPGAGETFTILKEAGFTTVALALREGSLDLRDARLAAADKLAVVLGTEGDGLRDETIDACDYTVRIPMAHDVDSLNVAACAAIAFWQLA